MNKTVIIAGIGTKIGKTIISAILTQAWQADYWKPARSGNPEEADALFIQKMVSNPTFKIWGSAYLLNQALSLYTAAKIDSITIHLNQINAPKTAKKFGHRTSERYYGPLKCKRNQP